jgi:Tfp pilus assembly protein PilF
VRLSNRWVLLAIIGTLPSQGCITSPNARYSVWPTKKAPDPTAVGTDSASAASLNSKLSNTAKGVKGQFSTVGTAVSSAYGKAKTAMSSAFSPAPSAAAPPDATSLATMPANPATIGPEINVMTGQMYESNGQYAKAMDYYSKALEAEPKNLSALCSMARLHDRQNNPLKAIEFYQKAVTVAPNQAGLYAELGNVQTRLGQAAMAKEHYQKAINLDPTNRSYRSSMAGLMIDAGQAEHAEAELRQVDTPAMAQYQMAYLYMSRQNVVTARQYLGKALAIDPNLQPARDMMNSLGGIQAVQQAGAMVQQANQSYQQAGSMLQSASQFVNTPVSTIGTAPANSP